MFPRHTICLLSFALVPVAIACGPNEGTNDTGVTLVDEDGTDRTDASADPTDTDGIDTGGTDTGGADEDTGSADTGSVDTQTPDTPRSDTAGSGGDGGGGGGSGRTGLEGYCDHYVDCGGTYYADAEECVQASIDHWGECRRDELDTFGNCMMELSCDEWGNPDAYNPSSTPCADEWSAIGNASCE